MKLTGHTILITGGSAGIGLAFAKRFVELGNEVIVTGRRQDALADIEKIDPMLHAIQSDVSDPVQIMQLATKLKTDFPRLDVLINNAGFSSHRNLRAPANDLTELMAEVDTNLGGVVRTTSAFIDILTANHGFIINISSALALVPMPSTPIYCATKAAVHSYTQSLRFQLEGTGVSVIEIMPPVVKTRMTAGLPGKGMAVLTTDELIAQVFPSLEKGVMEIRPGQAQVLALMSRIAPGLIGKRLWNAAKPQIPAAGLQ